MTDLTLVQLLRLIRDGTATTEQFARAQSLAEVDERLPQVIRQGVLQDTPAAEAAGLLALLEEDDGLLSNLADAVRHEAGDQALALDDSWAPISTALREAVTDEAGTIDISDAVWAAMGQADLPVADAVRSEAGEPAVVTDAVMARIEGAWLSAMLDNELAEGERAEAARRLLNDREARLQMTALADFGRDLRTAVRKEAGDAPDLWEGVAHTIGIEHPNTVTGWDDVPFADAVRAEAGEIDVVQPVMDTIVRHALAASIEVPEPANEPLTEERRASGRNWGPLMLLAALFLAVVVYRGPDLVSGETSPGDFIEGSDEIAFASPEEIVILDLDFSDDVTVFQAEGDEGALIIWIDDDDAGEAL